MSILQYTIVNQSAVAKTFTYFSASAYHKISVGGFDTIVFDASSSYTPTQDVTGVPENIFVSDAYIPPSGSAWLWNNGNKVQYIKISDTPLTGSNIDTIIKKAKWIEFSMVGAKDKDGNFLYPTSTGSALVERYIIDNVNDKGTYNSIIINDFSPETTIAVSANTSSAETGFSYIDQQFSINQDCDPLLNNATEPRLNDWLQDVDYSVNAIIPINFDQLINFTATKAAIPQSNYTQLGFTNSRYVGSSTTRSQINEYNPSSLTDIQNKLIYVNIDGSQIISPFLINKGKGPSLGKIPNVELNNAYIAYFNRIVDPYPLLNNKVAYYVKYLINESGEILDPNISDINFSIFRDTFQLNDYDDKPTRVNTAISSIEQGKELVKLTEGLSSVYDIGTYPVPILYTQTSSIGNIDRIALSGSKFYTALGLKPDGTPVDFLKLGMDIFATQSDAIPATDRLTPVTSFDLNELTWQPTNITPSKNNISPTTLPTSSVYPSSSILFPLDPSSSIPNTPGAILSDNYKVEGSFTFTTSTIPCSYVGGSGTGESNLEDAIKFYLNREKIGVVGKMAVGLLPYIKPFSENDDIAEYVNNVKVDDVQFNVKDVKLIITTDPGGSDEFIYPAISIPKDAGDGYGIQWGVGDGLELTLANIYPWSLPPKINGFAFTPNSLFIENLIIENLIPGGKGNIFNKDIRRTAIPLVAGGWASDGSGNTYGYGSKPVKYDWVVEFEFTNITQKIGLFLECQGDLSPQDDNKFLGRPYDVFLFFDQNGVKRSNWQWNRTFNPTYSTGVSTKPILKYSVTSRYTENAVENTANGPFWRRYPNTDDVLYMSSSILNQTYGKPFYQAKLPYTGSVNVDFPLTIEPSFIEFDPIVDFWQLQEGDEIRFQNDETLTYKVTEIIIDPLLNGDPFSEDAAKKLRVRVSPPFNALRTNGEIVIPSNFDFFVVRRYKENKNFIILNQQMPYGIISTGKGEIAFAGEDSYIGVEPVNPSSSPGLLLPQHRIDKFNVNPDLILKDLIEKKII